MIYVYTWNLKYMRKHNCEFIHLLYNGPVPVAARSKAWVSGRSPAEIVVSNPTGGIDVCLL